MTIVKVVLEEHWPSGLDR